MRFRFGKIFSIVFVCCFLTSCDFIYVRIYKDQIPKNFTLGKNLHYEYVSWCRSAVYEVEKFDIEDKDLFEKGFVEFRIGIKSFEELSDDARTSATLLSNLKFIKECSVDIEPLENKNEIIYSYKTHLHEFLFYHPKTKILYHMWGG